MARQLDFYFDCSSPWTYLAFHAIQPLAAETRRRDRLEADPGRRGVQCRQPDGLREPRQAQPAQAGLYAEGHAGLGATLRSRHHVPADGLPGEQRQSACAAPSWPSTRASSCPTPPPPSRPTGATIATFRRRTCWPTSPTKAGIERQRFFAGIETDSCKARLRANTDELIARGGFGSPTIFVGEQMFFGNDRLPLVKAALEQPHERQRRSGILGQGQRPSRALRRRLLAADRRERRRGTGSPTPTASASSISPPAR